MNTLEKRLAHMRKLVKLDAPACVKADFFVNVLVSQMAVEIGIQEVSVSLAKFMGQGIARYKGVCWICLKREVARGDDICPRCQVDTDQFLAAMDAAGVEEPSPEDDE